MQDCLAERRKAFEEAMARYKAIKATQPPPQPAAEAVQWYIDLHRAVDDMTSSFRAWDSMLRPRAY